MSNSEWHTDQDKAAAAEEREKREAALRAKEDSVLRALAEAVGSVLECDPHQWSARPCSTCRTISGLLGRPFGCEGKRR
jgi:hypothetical protein